MTGRMTGLLGVSLICLATACESDNTTSEDNAKLEAAVAALDTSARVASNPPLNDANAIFVLDRANVADSSLGRLASTKGTNADVKQYGRTMMADHHTLRAEARTLAARLNVRSEAPADDMGDTQVKEALDRFTAMPPGAAWDKAYIDHEIAVHRSVLEIASSARGTVQNPDLQAHIDRATPVLQGHLQRAEAIQKQLGGG